MLSYRSPLFWTLHVHVYVRLCFHSFRPCRDRLLRQQGEARERRNREDREREEKALQERIYKETEEAERKAVEDKRKRDAVAEYQ